MVQELLAVVSVAVPVGHHIKPDHKVAYQRDYKAVAHKFGPRTPGRNLIEDGLSSGHPVRDADVVRSIGVLKRMLTPPPKPTPISLPSQTVVSSATTGSVTGSAGCGGVTPYAGGGQCWAIPYSIVSCESKGQNVPNTQGSGAEGYYQLMSGGTGSKAAQDAAAAALWNGGQGASNWVCAG